MLLNNRSIKKVTRTVLVCSKNCTPCSSNGISASFLCSNSPIQKRSKVSLPDLPYDYSALEPVISAEIMQLHHSKHHQTYVNNYNVAAEKLSEAIEKGM